MKAVVNGQTMELTIRKQYHNGVETVYECTTENGVWVAVAESAVIKPNVRTKFEYNGDRSGLARVAVVTLTGKTEEEVEAAHELLVAKAAHEGYSAALCSNVEEGRNGKGFTITENFEVDSLDHAQAFKQDVYAAL